MEPILANSESIKGYGCSPQIIPWSIVLEFFGVGRFWVDSVLLLDTSVMIGCHTGASRTSRMHWHSLEMIHYHIKILSMKWEDWSRHGSHNGWNTSDMLGWLLLSTLASVYLKHCSNLNSTECMSLSSSRREDIGHGESMETSWFPHFLLSPVGTSDLSLRSYNSVDFKLVYLNEPKYVSKYRSTFGLLTEANTESGEFYLLPDEQKNQACQAIIPSLDDRALCLWS